MRKNVVDKMKQERDDLNNLVIFTVEDAIDLREQIAYEDNDTDMLSMIDLHRTIIQHYCDRDNIDYFKYEGRLDNILQFISFLVNGEKE